MDNNELLAQIGSMFGEFKVELRTDLDERFERQGNELRTEFDCKFDQLCKNIDYKMERQTRDLASMIEQQNQYIHDEIRDMKIFIENETTMRINSLYDGFQSVHEKQTEFEIRLSNVETKIGMVI